MVLQLLGSIFQDLFFPSLPSLLFFLSLPHVFLNHFLHSRNKRQTKLKSFPMQQCCQYGPTQYTPLISTVNRGHRNILSFHAGCLTMLLPHMILKRADLCFLRERSALPKKSKCLLTFSALGFSVYVTSPDRSGEERT